MTSQIAFSKYHGLGNDFVMVDSTNECLSLSARDIREMCDRKYGVGADGLIMLKRSPDHAFLIDYYNADGEIGSLCGNGSRCALAFAKELGLIGTGRMTFQACDGVHAGRFIIEENLFAVGLKDKRFEDIIKMDDKNYFLDNGSPHHVRLVENLAGYDVITEARQLRYGKYKEANGSNINFVEMKSDGDIFVRTYERGVENETDACGTGAVAVALVIAFRNFRSKEKGHGSPCDIHMGRGKLTITFNICNDTFTNIELIGGATHVFDGVYFRQNKT